MTEFNHTDLWPGWRSRRATPLGGQSRHSVDLLLCAAIYAPCLMALLWSLILAPAKLLLAVALCSALPTMVVALHTARTGTIVHPFALFAGSYSAYNGILLMRYAFIDLGDYPYPITISRQAVLQSAVLSALGAFAIVVVWLFRREQTAIARQPLGPGFRAQAFLVGAIFFFMALALFFVHMQQLGGYSAFVAVNRIARFQLERNVLSLPYSVIACAAVPFLFCGSEGSRWRRRFAWGTVWVWVTLFSLQGDRLTTLGILLAVAGTLSALNPKVLALQTKTIVWVVLLVIVAIVFGQLRSATKLIAINDAYPAIAGQYLDPSQVQDWFLPENTEIAGPYISVLYAVGRNRPLLLGRSYLDALPTFLPKALYPGNKPVFPSDSLSVAMSPGDAYPVGWGYSPVAEAYENFGFLGLPVVLAGWALFFQWLGYVRSRSLGGLIVSAALLQQTVNANRIDFHTVYVGSLFCVATGALGLIMMKGLRSFENISHSLDNYEL